MIVRVGLLDKSDNYISRLANYQNVHSNEAVQFEIYLFTEEQMLRRQMGRGGRIDVLRKKNCYSRQKSTHAVWSLRSGARISTSRCAMATL